MMDVAVWLEAAEQAADEVLGPLDGDLEAMVAGVSQGYTRDRTDFHRQRERDALQARTRFFMHRDLRKIFWPLQELFDAGGLPQGLPWRVLDLGAGVGTTGLGAAAFRGEVTGPEDRFELDIVAVDLDELGLKIYQRLAEKIKAVGESSVAPIRLSPHVLDLREPRLWPQGPFDLVLLGLVLNELEEDAVLSVLEAARARLAPEGSVLIMEPALKHVTRRLHRYRGTLLERGWTVFGPCLHRGPCPMLAGERDWCHREDPEFRLPPRLESVARGAGLRTHRSTFTDLTLRIDGLCLEEVRFDATERVVSEPLVSKGKLELFTCTRDSVGEASNRHHRSYRRLERHRSANNLEVEGIRRGELVSIRGAEARPNVHRIRPETLVRRVAGSADGTPRDT